MPRRLLYLLAHLIFAVKVEDVGNEVERILIVLHFGVQAREVETIGQVFLVDFAKVLVAAGGYELHALSACSRLREKGQAAATCMMMGSGSGGGIGGGEGPDNRGAFLPRDMEGSGCGMCCVTSRRRGRRRGCGRSACTYPIAPVAGIVAVGFTVEVVHVAAAVHWALSAREAVLSVAERVG